MLAIRDKINPMLLQVSSSPWSTVVGGSEAGLAPEGASKIAVIAAANGLPAAQGMVVGSQRGGLTRVLAAEDVVHVGTACYVLRSFVRAAK